jgi:hypothetical protein
MAVNAGLRRRPRGTIGVFEIAVGPNGSTSPPASLERWSSEDGVEASTSEDERPRTRSFTADDLRHARAPVAPAAVGRRSYAGGKNGRRSRGVIATVDPARFLLPPKAVIA